MPITFYSHRTLSQLIDVDWIPTTGLGGRVDVRLHEIAFTAKLEVTKPWPRARDIFPFSDVVSGHRRSCFCSTRRGRQKPPPDPSNFAPQISQHGPARRALLARSPLFCGDDLIELLLLLRSLLCEVWD